MGRANQTSQECKQYFLTWIPGYQLVDMVLQIMHMVFRQHKFGLMVNLMRMLTQQDHSQLQIWDFSKPRKNIFGFRKQVLHSLCGGREIK